MGKAEYQGQKSGKTDQGSPKPVDREIGDGKSKHAQNRHQNYRCDIEVAPDKGHDHHQGRRKQDADFLMPVTAAYVAGRTPKGTKTKRQTDF